MLSKEKKQDNKLSPFNYIAIRNPSMDVDVINKIEYTNRWIEPLEKKPRPIEEDAGEKRKKTRSSASKKCKQYLKNKIKKTMHEYKKKTKGIKNRKQALAIAYSQTKKKHPKCKF
tara:strand:- start:1489 stop:1833 length:345 start_codon:yes stop_codon:yes gene_type:complete